MAFELSRPTGRTLVGESSKVDATNPIPPFELYRVLISLRGDDRNRSGFTRFHRRRFPRAILFYFLFLFLFFLRFQLSLACSLRVLFRSSAGFSLAKDAPSATDQSASIRQRLRVDWHWRTWQHFRQRKPKSPADSHDVSAEKRQQKETQKLGKNGHRCLKILRPANDFAKSTQLGKSRSSCKSTATLPNFSFFTSQKDQRCGRHFWMNLTNITEFCYRVFQRHPSFKRVPVID